MSDESGNMPDLYDRLLGGMHGLPDVVQTKPTTLRYVEPVIGRTVTHIVQTIRQRDLGDHIFLEIVSGAGTMRVVIPPNVADAIARQREAVVTMSRRKAARAVAQDRKDRGEVPAFTKNPGRGGRAVAQRKEA